jgi:bifunctional non-homologous end joining protein LigD
MARKADPLSAYNAKRDFARTAEPRGERAKESGNRFIVQKHDATRLHFDFRIEADGVLKSWAVTRGPSPNPEDKRLAVRTEDHPLSYATFEGTIPAGEYGGGTVMLWDSGHWAPVEGKSARDIDKGHLHFTLDGERMKGEWLLIRLKPRAGEKRENWLLRKIDDEHAGGSDDLVGRHVTSITTGRSMAEIAAGAKPKVQGKETKAQTRTAAAAPAGARRRRSGAGKPPAFAEPQLATLVDAVPEGAEWVHEIKFDGYRCLAAVAGEEVRLHTRSGLDWTDRFPGIAEALRNADLPAALIDGEVVATDAEGNPNFSILQARLREGAAQDLQFHAFDLLAADGNDLTALPLTERKAALSALLAALPAPIHIAEHIAGHGEKLFAAMCSAGQEGIISKRADAPYRSGRTKAWLKVKCTRRQEFVIVGWSPSSARGRPFSSLLLAQREGGTLVYKGKVGTGFDTAMMADVAARLDKLAAKAAPVEVPAAERRGARWVKPELVAEVAFAEFTGDGRVRHGSFIALREDKAAADVAPERPQSAPKARKRLVAISNPDRVIFPDSGQTKGQLADYYEDMAPLMLPHLARRPVSLVRCPQGRGKQCFFQKHDSGAFGETVLRVPIREKDGDTADYLAIEDATGILACVQMGSIEFHGWASRAPDVEKPERMVFDLDPDEGLDYAEVRRAAVDICARLADIGLASFAMLSGGKGVHVVVPLTPGHDWAAHSDFARRFAEALSLAEPDRFVATMSKAKRKGRIFIDWLRNQRGSTAILPYSARARPGAPVAAPVSWAELETIDRANRFSIDDGALLAERAGSPDLAGWGLAEQPLPDL